MESWVQSLEMHALAMVVEDLEYIRPYVKKIREKNQMKSEVWALAHGSCLLNVQRLFSGLFYCVCLL